MEQIYVAYSCLRSLVTSASQVVKFDEIGRYIVLVLRKNRLYPQANLHANHPEKCPISRSLPPANHRC